jgi:putative phosphoesterase
LSQHISARICGVLSDTHGAIDNQILDYLSDSDVILHAGDIGSFEVIKKLTAVTPKFFAVAGNNDKKEKWPQNQHSKLKRIPCEIDLQINHFSVYLTHGHQFNPAAKRHLRLRKLQANKDLVVYGHSHHLISDLENKPWIINPGAAGKVRTHGGASCIKLVFEEGQIHINEFRSNHSTMNASARK